MVLKFVRSLTKTMFEVFVCSCVLLDMGLLPPTAFSTKDWEIIFESSIKQKHEDGEKKKCFCVISHVTVFCKTVSQKTSQKMIKYSHKSTHASLSAKNKNEWWLALRLEVVHISLELWVLWAIDRRSRSPTRDLCHQLTCKLLLINSTSQLEAWPED